MKDKQIGGPAAIVTIAVVLVIAVIVGLVYANRPVNNLSSDDAAKAAAMHRANGG